MRDAELRRVRTDAHYILSEPYAVIIIGKKKAKGGATMMKERFRLTFVCGEPGCDKTAVVLYDARPAETLEQLRQRNPIFLAVLCGAKHFGNYPASAAIDITVPVPSK